MTLLGEHPLSSAQQPPLQLAIVAVHHEVRSNVGSDQTRGAPEPGFVYRNRAEVLPLSQPVRALTGPQAWAQRPNASGVQTAIVVGLGAPLHTDRDHRVKLQFHWQRGGQSSHRLHHAGGANAPAGDGSGTWVRVAEGVAGPNWGASFTPRLGQEALVDFIEGDIDRPVVMGALYNGVGSADAQANDTAHGAATSTGNAASLTSGQDITLNAQRHGAIAVKDGIVCYTVGEARDPAKPNTETGIAWHSATGSNSVQAQGGAMQWNAQLAVAIDSTTGSVTVAAPQKVVVNGAGSYLRLEGGDIELGTSGGSAFKGAMKELAGAGSANASLRLKKAGKLAECPSATAAAAGRGVSAL